MIYNFSFKLLKTGKTTDQEKLSQEKVFEFFQVGFQC